MSISYDNFTAKLNERIKSDEVFYYDLLITVINNPSRYTGFFRLSNAKTKLIQNVTQSREIKFGDFMEEIVTDYIEQMGYTNLNKNIGTDDEGNDLSADQVFKLGDKVYLIEQKIRDDHDSTKKRGQYENFRKKYLLLKRQYPRCTIDASMWFIDDSLKKNKKYYKGRAAAETTTGIDIHILYGIELFEEVFNRVDVWEELCSYLARNKRERSEEILTVPDFDTSEEMLQALKKLKQEEPKIFKKLLSNKPQYIQLRNELFPTGKNLTIVNK